MVRSRSGCLTCRNRKLKCDEIRPICSHCRKGNRDCIPSPGLVFRHQQNASMGAEDGEGLKSFYGYREKFTKDSIWVPIPRQLTFVQVNDPYDDVSSEALAGPSTRPNSDDTVKPRYRTLLPAGFDTHGLEALSAVAASGVHSLQARDETGLGLSIGSSALDPRLEDDNRDAYIAETPTLQEKDEIPFLLSQFASGPGHWMDLFDSDQFFESQLPLLVSKHALLLYSAVALSAKVLGRMSESVRRQRDERGRVLSASMWSHTARSFYDRAVHLLREKLAGNTRTSPDVLGMIESSEVEMTETDELVAVAAILSVYELLDASAVEWSRHLDGVKSLFDVVHTELDTISAAYARSTELAGSKRWGPVRTALFWNFARQDMLDGYIGDARTRLSTDDVQLWRALGLHLDDDAGGVLPSNVADIEPMPDMMICNALVWLNMRVGNYIADCRDRVSADKLAPTWYTLCRNLDAWLEGLPASFMHTQRDAADEMGICRTWYERPMHASTMQWYYFARLQLICHRPQLVDSDGGMSTSFPLSFEAPLLSEPTDFADALVNAKELIGVALVAQDEGVRVHSVQPLYVAGKILGVVPPEVQIRQPQSMSEIRGLRMYIRELLVGIEEGTGWATGYRVEQLIEQWREA